MLRLVVLALVVTAGQCLDYNQTVCGSVWAFAGSKWKAEITLSEPITLTKAIGGNVTSITQGGKHIELNGTAEHNINSVCITLIGSHAGLDPPTSLMVVYVLPVGTREISRDRRATEIWHVSSVPQTSNIRNLLQPFEPYHHQWGDDSLSASTKHSSSPALTVHYAKGSYTKTPVRGGGFFSTPTNLPDGLTSLILKYDVYFENFGFGIGGKLPGLFGGVRGEGAYLCSGGNNPSTCFSLRLMWRANGDAEVYAYIPDNQASDFEHRSDVHVNYQYGHSLMRGALKFRNNQWQTVTEEVHLNTPHQFDGRVKLCVQHQGEAQQCHEVTRLNIRNDPNFYLRGFFFSTFFGGSTPDFAAPNDCHTYFKAISLSTPTGTVVG